MISTYLKNYRIKLFHLWKTGQKNVADISAHSIKFNFSSYKIKFGVILAKWHCRCLNEEMNLQQTGGRRWKLLSKHAVGFQRYSHSESFYQHVRAARGRIFSLTWFLNAAALCATRAKRERYREALSILWHFHLTDSNSSCRCSFLVLTRLECLAGTIGGDLSTRTSSATILTIVKVMSGFWLCSVSFHRTIQIFTGVINKSLSSHLTTFLLLIFSVAQKGWF